MTHCLDIVTINFQRILSLMMIINNFLFQIFNLFKLNYITFQSNYNINTQPLTNYNFVKLL